MSSAHRNAAHEHPSELDGFTATSLTPALVADAFRAQFGRDPMLFRAPGRINLIGEHTDYTGGFAMPAAIDRHCIAAVAANGGARLRIHSLNLRRDVDRPVYSFQRAHEWSDYVAGVAAALQRAGADIPGCDILVASSVPLGAGVSSSAALEVATALALLRIAGRRATAAEIARWAWEAEAEFVGAPCGPMDQYASVNGKADHALLLDCRALTSLAIPAPGAAAFAVLDSGVSHAIVDGGYEARRRDCEEAASLLGVDSLRDATHAMLERAALPDQLHRRTRHVLSENARTLAMADALRATDLSAAGRLIDASHMSLQRDFDVTCPETDLLAEIARVTPGVFGARQMGGGFGGGVLMLADADACDAAAAATAAAYRQRTGKGGAWFRCRLADGAGEIVP